MSDYDQDNRKGYHDCENEKYDEYYESDHYDLIPENNEYAKALLRSKDGWFYDEEPRTIGDAIEIIY